MREPWNLAVIGLGRAGRARVRDIPLAGARLAATVSRRPGLGSHTLAQVLADADIHACVIATENASHAGLAEACLRAGKHVLVEFPLTDDPATARRLYAIDRGLVLHVELIGLLTADQTALRQTCLRERPARVQLGFTGGCEGWLADEARAGHWGQLAVARLHALWDALGPLQLQRAAVETSSDGYRLVVDLLARATQVRLIEVRVPGLARGRTLDLTRADGSPIETMDVEDAGPGLFLRDLQAFLTRIDTRGDTGAYVSDADVLAVLDLAAAISEACA
jgi:predicted dehydrogenase